MRAGERDKVEIYKSFRPGDVIMAKVLSLGDAQSYYLTTSENELGVVFAKSVAGKLACSEHVRPTLTALSGAPMVAVSWCEMQCEQTGAKEWRKVARV